MKTRSVTRHWCDHCSKGGFTRPAMAKHEQRCVKNADRVCGMCAYAKLEQQPTPKLINALRSEAGWEALVILVSECPACLLTALVHERKDRTGSFKLTADEWNGPHEPAGWEFKKAATAFLAEHRPEGDEDFYP